MKFLTLTGIPSPEAFFDVRQGSDLSLFIEDDESSGSSPIPVARGLGMRCISLFMGGGGVSLTGEVTSPPIYRGRLALVDICWDTHPTYTGQAAISDIEPITND